MKFDFTDIEDVNEIELRTKIKLEDVFSQICEFFS